VVTLQSAGVPETIPQEAAEGMQPIIDNMVAVTMLKRAATLDDVGNAAVFAASDWARTMTATALNITCGAVVD
jgi:3-oxoacyl-[acyl-carrier protein] reductase